MFSKSSEVDISEMPNLIFLIFGTFMHTDEHGMSAGRWVARIFDSYRPCDNAQLQNRVSSCMDDVGLCMRSNRLHAAQLD